MSHQVSRGPIVIDPDVFGADLVGAPPWRSDTSPSSSADRLSSRFRRRRNCVSALFGVGGGRHEWRRWKPGSVLLRPCTPAPTSSSPSPSSSRLCAHRPHALPAEHCRSLGSGDSCAARCATRFQRRHLRRGPRTLRGKGFARSLIASERWRRYRHSPAEPAAKPPARTRRLDRVKKLITDPRYRWQIGLGHYHAS